MLGEEKESGAGVCRLFHVLSMEYGITKRETETKHLVLCLSPVIHIIKLFFRNVHSNSRSNLSVQFNRHIGISGNFNWLR